jgi:O-acetylserine/cysteine efflux transporter
MKPVDIVLAVGVAVLWGLAFVASRIALDAPSPLRLAGMVIVVCGIAVMLKSKRPQAIPEIA